MSLLFDKGTCFLHDYGPDVLELLLKSLGYLFHFLIEGDLCLLGEVFAEFHLDIKLGDPKEILDRDAFGYPPSTSWH